MTGVSTAPIDMEIALWKRGFRYIIGFDEAGRGAIAGPIHIGWAVLPLVKALGSESPESSIRRMHMGFEGVRDSKKIKSSKTATAHQKRLEVVNRVSSKLISGGAVSETAQKIDEVGIAIVCHVLVDKAIEQAIQDIRDFISNSDEGYYPEPTVDNVYLLCDNGLFPDFRLDYDGTEVVKGDALSVTIAMASLFAKTHRDTYMMELHEDYPVYNFLDHMGYYAYGKPHMDVVHQNGIIREYRRTFAPIKDWLAEGSVKILEA